MFKFLSLIFAFTLSSKVKHSKQNVLHSVLQSKLKRTLKCTTEEAQYTLPSPIPVLPNKFGTHI